MKRLLLIVLFLLFSTTARADSSITFQWLPNSESDLKEYKLYQSDTSGNYAPGIDIPVAIIPAGTETVTINGVKDGVWFWVMTASDFHGNESEKSNEVTKSLDTISPGSPEALNVVITVRVEVE